MPDFSRISVITVCFNSAKTLERNFTSVARQTWPSIEHIVIDGSSTDGTASILERFRGCLAHVVSEPDKGIYDAMNKGLERASGNIVCFLNADDYYASPHVLSHVVEEMRNHDLDALLGDVVFFDAHSPERTVRRYRSDRFKPSRLAWGWMPAHPGLFLRREVLQRVGRFNTNYRIAGDYEFIVRVFHGQSVRYKHLNEVLVRMQAGGASTSGWRAKVLLNQEVLRACRENGLSTNWLKILSKYPLKLSEWI